MALLDTVFPDALQRGAVGPDVARAQSLLVDLAAQISSTEQREQRFGPSTASAVAAFQATVGLARDGTLGPPTLQRLVDESQRLARAVHGTVSLADGTPAAGLRVVAFHRAFRSEKPLGEATTDARGRYHVDYRIADAVTAGQPRPNLGIRVVAADGQTPLFASDAASLLIDAPADSTIDARVAPPDDAKTPSEFERLERAIAPLMGDAGVASVSSDPASDEGAFLARELDVPRSVLAQFVMAHRLTERTQLPAAWFHALLREDGLFGIGPGRPRLVLTPVDFATDAQAVLYEAVLLDPKTARAAVTRAVRKRLVPPDTLRQADAVVERLQGLHAQASAYVDKEMPRRWLGVVDDLIVDGKSGDLATLLGSIDLADFPALVDRLVSRGLVADGAAATAAATRLQLGDLLGFNLGLVDEVAQSLDAATPDALQKLAQMERKDWTALLAAGNVRVGGSPVDPAIARRQASVIVRRFEKRFPTAAFSAQLRRTLPAAIPQAAQIADFLDTNPALELLHHRVRPWLKARRTTPSAAGTAPAAPDLPLLQGVERVQRVFRLTGDYRKSEGLLRAGYGAAADIVAAGRTQFVADAGRAGGIGKAEATRIFRTAENVHVGALTVAMQMRTLSQPALLTGDGDVALAAKIERVVAEQPDLAALFGAPDVCACSHCRSIYSPAAYFADAMRYTRNRLVKDSTQPPPVASTRTALDVLLSRRPDLVEIDLDCNNAEVPVPHIDIVCELLEAQIAPDAGFAFNGAVAAGAAPADLLAAVRAAGHDIGEQALVYGPYAPDRYMLRDPGIAIAVDGPGPAWTLRLLRQTHGSAAERAASPEYLNTAAYGLLATLKAAFDLPFDLFHAETRALLAAAGIRRAELMQALAVGGAPSTASIAGEALGLSAAERAVIVAPSIADQPAVWGVAGPTASATMKRLDVFTARTGLDYAGTDAVLHGAWVRSGVDLFIRHLDNSCELSAKEIQNLDDTVLDRLHRLLRLSRRSGLATRDLDRLAQAPRLGGGDLGDAALSALADLLALAPGLGVDIPRLVTWLDLIPTDGSPSDHAELFQNPAATGALDPALAPAAIAQNEIDEANVPGSGGKLADVAADLAVAFGTRATDLQVLLDHLSQPAWLGAAPALGFRALALLYGRIGLARALGLDARGLVALERLSGIDPLAGSDALRRFVEVAGRIAARQVSVSDLDYRLARRADDLALRDLSDLAALPVLQALRAGLLAAQAANRSPYDDSLQSIEQVGVFESFLQRRAALDAAAIAALLDLVRLAAPDAAAGALAKAVVDGPLAGGDPADLTPADATAVKATIDAIVAAPADESARKTFLKLLMQAMSTSTLQAAAHDLAVSTVATLLQSTAERADAVLSGARLTVASGLVRLADLLTQGDIVDETKALSAASTPDLFRALRLAWAIAGLVAPFDPPPDALAFVLARATDLGWLAPDALPFEAGVPAVALDAWLDLSDGIALLARFAAVDLPGQPGATRSAQSVFELALSGTPDKAALLDTLAFVTGWPRDVLADADTRLAPNVADYRRPATWRAVERAVLLLHALAVPLAEAVAYTADALTDTDRRNARRLLRARYSSADWLPALRALTDPLREMKRDALVAWLLAANPDLRSKEDLYDWFLTDTQWSPRMPSSRLVHAHATLQLFLRRCLEGLEPRAVADRTGDADWSQWEWMKHYRVWEVARKVFVEAQYHINPTWRDDKTEPFDAFESDLLQNEVNADNITAAYEGYLDRLDEIAFLDVLATCYDLDQQTLHVFAATKGGEPRSYFHRTLQRERVWTAWEKIDLDISGDHLIGFFRNRRLYLAWATFLEKGDDQQQATYPTPGGGPQDLPPSERSTDITLAVSEYTGRKWLPRRVSADSLQTPRRAQALDTATITLGVTPDANRFTVDVFQSVGTVTRRLGYFLLTGCKGYPEARAVTGPHIAFLPTFVDTRLRGQRLVEQDADGADDRLAIVSGLSGASGQTLFGRTPGIFRVTYPFQASEIDRLLTALYNGTAGQFSRDIAIQVFGTLMPFFFEDNEHGYVLIPGFYGAIDPETGERKTVKTFSNVRQLLVDTIALLVKYLQLLAAAPTPADKAAVIAQFVADPELHRILAEIDSYKATTFGIVVRNFYHPMACRMRQRFSQGGVQAMLSRESQREIGAFRFEDAVSGYAPSTLMLPPWPREEVEFGRDSAHAAYNWELTFHAPHLIATKLMEAGQYDDAETWLRLIFDPRGTPDDPSPQRYWNTRPFFERSPADYADQTLTSIMERLADDPGGAVETELADAVLDWRRSPLQPYLVARSRTVVFQQAIVDTTARMLLGRGDQAFARDQLEDLVEASLDYSRLERLLGRSPQIVPPAVPVPPENWNQLSAKIDLFGNAMRTLENLLPDLSTLPHGGAELPTPPITLESLYFCIPPSEQLTGLWDTLAERQFNLRNSRTIDGVERDLSLFAPPLSVDALIQAAASGLSPSAVLAELGAPRPPYRFRVMLRHAQQLADVAAAIDGRHEQAITQGDAEGLQRLRIESEGKLMTEQRAALVQEIEAALQGIAVSTKARQMQLETQSFFAGRPYMNPLEIAATTCYGTSFGLQALMAVGYVAAAGLAAVPKFMVGAAGFGGSPTANMQIGGDQLSQAASNAMVGAVGAASSALDKAGSMLEHQANYMIRQQDWQHAASLAQREAERAALEIQLAGIRKTIAEEQLRVHGVRQQQVAAEEAYLRGKFTSRELYAWQTGQLRGLSRRVYQLAFEAAIAAQRCFNFELGRSDALVRSGQWNESRRGLLAGHNLIADLQSLESAWLARNARERDITQTVSLARLDPVALQALRTTGRCTVDIPEAFFDLDHPGDYFRRIRSLAMSVPSVVGPYGTVALTVTQTANRVRVDTGRRTGAANDVDAYTEDPAGDPRFRYNVGSIQSIVTSRGENDGGVFDLHLDDDRYLPFEGSGLCGTYVLEFPPVLRSFDYATTADVQFNFRYGARPGGSAFRTLAAKTARERLNVALLAAGRTGLYQAIDLRRDKPDVWYQLTSAGASALTVTEADFPYFVSGHAAGIASARLLARVAGAPASFSLSVGGAAVVLNAAPEPELAGLLSATVGGVTLGTALALASALPSKLQDLVIVLNYQLTV